MGDTFISFVEMKAGKHEPGAGHSWSCNRSAKGDSRAQTHSPVRLTINQVKISGESVWLRC
jgi:hypothetical protein